MKFIASLLATVVVAELNHVKEWISLRLEDTHHGWFFTTVTVGGGKDYKVLIDTSFSGLAVHSTSCAECDKKINLYNPGEQ
jgi:hypothetical protein